MLWFIKIALNHVPTFKCKNNSQWKVSSAHNMVHVWNIIKKRSTLKLKIGDRGNKLFFGWVKLKNSLWQIHRYSLLIFLSSSLYFYCINSIFWAELWWCFFCERIFGDFFELLLKLCDLNRNFAMILSQIFSIHNEMLLNFFITFFLI